MIPNNLLYFSIGYRSPLQAKLSLAWRYYY
uniref:Uncharacterized protein n=1 Tax=virus sp. ctPYc18 TaxID=2828251 RepID=A0A8S5RD48_9VIRU|nr:MAG TPA: hypothetical protein [virus sp. ctPYc18]